MIITTQIYKFPIENVLNFDPNIGPVCIVALPQKDSSVTSSHLAKCHTHGQYFETPRHRASDGYLVPNTFLNLGDFNFHDEKWVYFFKGIFGNFSSSIF